MNCSAAYCSTPQTCCIPCNFPFAQVTMTCPPPICLPTKPEPIKPLQLPCPKPKKALLMTLEEAEISRYDNFYNNYNIDWHNNDVFSPCDPKCRPCCTSVKQKGQTLDGSSPCCFDYSKNDTWCPLPGCPTGFKPCSVNLIPPQSCDPCGFWKAKIQPCPPKRKKNIQ